MACKEATPEGATEEPSDGERDPSPSGAGGASSESLAECLADGCPDGQACAADGSCVDSGDDIIVTQTGGEKATGGAPSCVDVQVQFDPIIPTVALVIDRSGSMGADLTFGLSVLPYVESGSYVPWGCSSATESDLIDQGFMYRWNVVRNVLFNPTDGVVPRYEGRVRFGLTLYTHDPDLSPTCPALIESEVALGNSKELLAIMQCDDVGRYTPTREALTVVAAELGALEATGPKMILLATDGAPTTCECPRFSQGSGSSVPDHCLDDALVERDGQMLAPIDAAQYDVVEEVRRINGELGISVSVVGVAAQELPGTATTIESHLRAVADAGGGAYYDGVDPVGLSDAFVTSVEKVRSCEVDLQGEITAGSEEKGIVTLDGAAVSLATPGEDGYRVVSSSRIELLGGVCEEFRAGGHELDISFPCGAFEVVK